MHLELNVLYNTFLTASWSQAVLTTPLDIACIWNFSFSGTMINQILVNFSLAISSACFRTSNFWILTRGRTTLYKYARPILLTLLFLSCATKADRDLSVTSVHPTAVSSHNNTSTNSFEVFSFQFSSAQKRRRFEQYPLPHAARASYLRPWLTPAFSHFLKQLNCKTLQDHHYALHQSLSLVYWRSNIYGVILCFA